MDRRQMAIFFGGFPGACGKSDLEDQAQYECFNPGVRPVWDVLRKQVLDAAVLEEKQLRSLQTTDPATTVGKNPGQDLDETASIDSVMLKVHYCLENQSVNEAWRIMREHDARYLLVLDNNLQVVGVVTVRDLVAWYES